MDRLSTTLKTLPQVTREFIGALRMSRTYNIFENWYCLFGILWGIPVPIVTIAVALNSSALLVTTSNIVSIISSRPYQLFFILHPIFFGIIFGAMGTVRYNKERRIEEFGKSLIDKNLELAEKNEKLRELDKLKSNFLSMISHELRTPLTTIHGYISFLITEKAGAVSNTQKECLEISQEASELLNRLIDDLLDLSRIESGEFKITPGEIDMAELVDKAILSRRLSADNRGIVLENNLPANLPLVRADGGRILQVITNLLENGIKFNRKGGNVSVTAISQSSKNIVFCVSDTGIGIPKDELNRVFDKFYQVDSSGKRKYGGCGLGLAISKSIIELHHGRIWLESELGVGSKFYFELPL